MVSISSSTQIVRIRATLTKNDTDITFYIVLHYKSIDFRPSKVNIQFANNELGQKAINKLLIQLKSFTERDLLDGYKAFFKI